MKKGLLIIMAAFLMVGYISCKKDDAAVTADNSLQVSKTTAIQKGEPVVFTFPQAAATSDVKWSVSPANTAQINANGNKASVSFGESKEYTVTATSAGTTASSKVSVTNQAFNTVSASGTLQPFQDGETFKAGAIAIDSGAIYNGVGLSVLTTKQYDCLSSVIVTEVTKDANGYTITYTGVKINRDYCENGKSYAGAFNFLTELKEGTNTLNIIVNGKTYTGTIVKADKKYTITWPDASVVSISPTTL